MPPAAAPRQPRNWVALVLSVVTGFGHFYLDHYVAGAVLFGLFVTALNGVFLGFTLQATSSPEMLRAVSIFAFVVVWAFGFWHAYRLSYGTDRVALAQAKDALLREGLIDYLRDDLEDAARKIERACALDVDWLDPDPLFHLGVVLSRLADRKASRGDASGAKVARRRSLSAFKACLNRDPTRKWRAEVAEEQKRMRNATFTGRMRAVGAGIKDVLTTASGMFLRPGTTHTHAEVTPPFGLRPPSAATATAADLKSAEVRAAITQTRKKKRFSAKYPALKSDEQRTRADLRLPVAPQSPPPLASDQGPVEPPTRPDLSAELDRERSAARRFPRPVSVADETAPAPPAPAPAPPDPSP